jgi:hypothetical protein
MESAVRQYEIQYRPIPLSWWRKLVVVFGILVGTGAFRWGVEYLFHWKHQSGIGTLFVSMAVGGAFAWRPFQNQLLKKGRLTLGDDFVEHDIQTGWFTVKKRIRRDQIKFISEDRHGLRVMNRGKFGTFMRGFVFVPATMPEYQEIRAVLGQWTPIRGQGR